jgi:hypothetical protein
VWIPRQGKVILSRNGLLGEEASDGKRMTPDKELIQPDGRARGTSQSKPSYVKKKRKSWRTSSHCADSFPHGQDSQIKRGLEHMGLHDNPFSTISSSFIHSSSSSLLQIRVIQNDENDQNVVICSSG